jgi:hypothetical protein
MGKLRGIPLSSLGRPALLQLQAMGIDVRKYLDGSTQTVVTPRAHKFGVSAAVDRTEDGLIFDSKLEAGAYRLLTNWHVPFDRQVEFELESEFEFEGRKYRAVKYVADFVLDPKGKRLVVDIKGFRTKMYDLKAKLMLKRFGIKIINIKKLPELALLVHDHGLLVRNESSNSGVSSGGTENI